MRGNRSSDPSPICFIPSLVLDNAYFRSITNTSIIYFTTSVNIYNTVFTTINNSARLLLFKVTYLLGVKYRHNNHQNTQNNCGNERKSHLSRSLTPASFPTFNYLLFIFLTTSIIMFKPTASIADPFELPEPIITSGTQRTLELARASAIPTAVL